MTITRTSNENMDKRMLYKLTKGKDNKSITTVQDELLNIVEFVLFEDVNSKGEEVEVLSLLDDSGEIFTTISETFKADFFDIVDTFKKEDFPTIKVIGATSKNGRNYVACTVA